jgi:2-epi-5-epi-valiolone synthase
MNKDVRPTGWPVIRRFSEATMRRAFEVGLSQDLWSDGVARLTEAVAGERVLVVTTPTVARCYALRLRAALLSAGVDMSVLVLPGDESRKRMEHVERICTEYFRLKLNRQSFLLALGGGVCSDMVTMAASMIRRGVRHVRVPTTLIGQIDAAIGIKGAVNFDGRKNSLGCYHPPSFVLIAPELLATLPSEHLIGGLAESIKMAVLRDGRLFDLLEQHGRELIDSQFAEPQGVSSEVLWRSIERMLEELETNFFEDQTYERLVDFGHSFSPSLEAASDFTLPHGQAVAIDIALSSVLAAELNLLECDVRNRIVDLLRDVGLPTWSPLLTETLAQQSLHDMQLHRGGHVNLVVPTGIGTATFLRQVEEIPQQPLRAALAWLQTQSSLDTEVAGTGCRQRKAIPPWKCSSSTELWKATLPLSLESAISR